MSSGERLLSVGFSLNCYSVTVECNSKCANEDRRELRLRVKDDFWDLSVLHRRAVVVPGGVAESEAGFGAGA